MSTLRPVTDLHEIATAPDGAPPPPRHGRVVLMVVACAAVAGLVSLLVVALGTPGGNVAGSGPATTARADGAAAGAPQRLDSEAAVRNGWTLVAHEEFDGDALDEDVWSPYKGHTTADVGRHDPDNISVSDGTLKLTSRGSTSAGLAWDEGQKYGRWEVRARSQAGTGYGPVVLLWPDAEDWPEGGEIDIVELPKPDRAKAHFTVHWGEDNHQDSASVEGDFTQWHTFAVEWTPEHVIGYVDGDEIYRTTRKDAIPPRSLHLAMQQDIGPYGDDWIPARDGSTPGTCTFEVDWVRIYAA
jgi:beta-glucanase (GH16 family)